MPTIERIEEDKTRWKKNWKWRIPVKDNFFSKEFSFFRVFLRIKKEVGIGRGGGKRASTYKANRSNHLSTLNAWRSTQGWLHLATCTLHTYSIGRAASQRNNIATIHHTSAVNKTSAGSWLPRVTALSFSHVCTFTLRSIDFFCRLRRTEGFSSWHVSCSSTLPFALYDGRVFNRIVCISITYTC